MQPQETEAPALLQSILHTSNIMQCPTASDSALQLPQVRHRHWPQRALPFASLLRVPLHTLSNPEAHAIACKEPETSNSAVARWLTCTNVASMGFPAKTPRLTTPVARRCQRHPCPEAAQETVWSSLIALPGYKLRGAA